MQSKDFSIVHRGVKFLNSFPEYKKIREKLGSVAESLYNCENIIPLQDSRSVSYEEFISIFREDPLLNYLLNIELPSSRDFLEEEKK